MIFNKSFVSIVILSSFMLLAGASPAEIARADSVTSVADASTTVIAALSSTLIASTETSAAISSTFSANTKTSTAVASTVTAGASTTAVAAASDSADASSTFIGGDSSVTNIASAQVSVTNTAPESVTVTATPQSVTVKASDIFTSVTSVIGADPKVTAYVTTVLDTPVVAVSSVSGSDVITLATQNGTTTVFSGHTLVAQVKEGNGASGLTVSKGLLSGAAAVGAVAAGALAVL